nr:MAG TPA: hypothetical protein [Bacteriophage sp.]
MEPLESIIRTWWMTIWTFGIPKPNWSRTSVSTVLRLSTPPTTASPT